jgi:hypothetical protein
MEFEILPFTRSSQSTAKAAKKQNAEPRINTLHRVSGEIAEKQRMHRTAFGYLCVGDPARMMAARNLGLRCSSLR